MKTSRQEMILEIITSRDVETQGQLIDELAARGVKSTQATLSRDIKELRLVKELTGAGKYRYAAGGKEEMTDFDLRLKKIFRESVTSYAVAQNLIVIRTLPGLASAACAALDGMDIDGLVGTLAGDDTAFIAMRDNTAAENFESEIEKLLQLSTGGRKMLQDLHIENIAVIERADISFAPGLNVLTGETGAGKSIVIDALLAIMGSRTSRELVRTGADKALATAVFSIDRARNWLRENELEADDELILQRRISDDGKSSCRVCGSPVTAAQLRELSGLLLDIHGQNDGRQLMDETRHREYLDSYGAHDGELREYAEAYAAYNETKKEIKRLSMDEAEKSRLSDILKITVEELENAELREGEEEELSARRDLLHNAEKLTEAINAAYETLYGGDDNAVSLTEGAKTEAARAARYCAELESIEKTLTDASFMLRDAAEGLRDFLRNLDFSQEEYDRLETRLAQLRRLSKKYGGGEKELLEKLEKSKRQLDDIEYSDDRLKKLSAQLEARRNAVTEVGKKLTEERKKAAAILERKIVSELSALAMPSVSFTVDIIPIESENGFDATGADNIRFLMSANRGEKPGPISKIASGGELSRIMLAMKNVFSERDGIETLVFDEIDTGVSGVAASRVGEKLAELSRHKQVLCVTHLPQIAAMADTHFRIEKDERDGRTYTSVTMLDREGRKRELARLHGGDNITENTLISAAEQLDAAESFKRGLG